MYAPEWIGEVCWTIRAYFDPALKSNKKKYERELKQYAKMDVYYVRR